MRSRFCCTPPVEFMPCYQLVHTNCNYVTNIIAKHYYTDSYWEGLIDPVRMVLSYSFYWLQTAVNLSHFFELHGCEQLSRRRKITTFLYFDIPHYLSVIIQKNLTRKILFNSHKFSLTLHVRRLHFGISELILIVIIYRKNT